MSSHWAQLIQGKAYSVTSIYSFWVECCLTHETGLHTCAMQTNVLQMAKATSDLFKNNTKTTAVCPRQLLKISTQSVEWFRSLFRTHTQTFIYIYRKVGHWRKLYIYDSNIKVKYITHILNACLLYRLQNVEQRRLTYSCHCSSLQTEN